MTYSKNCLIFLAFFVSWRLNIFYLGREKFMRRQLTIIMALIVLLNIFGAGGASAHANLVRTEPGINSALDAPPEEIRLWFTEPLEQGFSRIILRDADGNQVDIPDATVDPSDPLQLFVRLGDLPEGLYTVDWRALSTVDGHTTRGSFPFVIGDAAGLSGFVADTGIDETIPVDSAVVRWLNFVSLALGVGSVAFWLFVWQPAITVQHDAVERRMRRVIWLGWIFTGVTGVLLLLLQVADAADVSLFAAAANSSLTSVIQNTRFGELWTQRMVLWGIMGAAIFLARDNDKRFYWTAFFAGGWILLTVTLNSHAAAEPRDSLAAMAADYIHLLAMVVWFGGLIQFVNIITPVRKSIDSSTQTLGRLVAYFSNYARLPVAILVITGTYAAWLQIGSIDALFNTRYGQMVVVKVALMIPLIILAAVNMIFTHRGLRNGQDVWAGRLRRLVGVEIGLVIGVLIAVGVMTAIPTGLEVETFRTAEPPQVAANPYYEGFYAEADNLHVDLQIFPGTVGENEFTIFLYNHEGEAIEDASRIRLRFENQDQNLGESELRPEHVGDGVYKVRGANLSTPGDWRIRATVSRPDAFDTIADFTPTVEAASAAPVALADPNIVRASRVPVLMLTGFAIIIAGGLLGGGLIDNLTIGRSRAKGRTMRTVSPMPVVALSPDGRLLVTMGDDHTLDITDMKSGEVQHTLTGHEAAVQCVAFSPGGTYLASGDDAGLVRVWDVEAGEDLAEIDVADVPVWSVAFNPESSLLAVGDVNGQVSLWDTDEWEHVADLPAIGAPVNYLAFGSNDAALIYGNDNALHLWDMQANEAIGTQATRQAADVVLAEGFALRQRLGPVLLATAMVIVGVAFFASGIVASGEAVSAATPDADAANDDAAAVNIALENRAALANAAGNTTNSATSSNAAAVGSAAPRRIVFSRQDNLPYLITGDGVLLQPDDSTETWQPVDVDAAIQDAYFDIRDTLWVSTTSGLEAFRDGEWISVDDIPADRLVSTHGYLFSLGNGEISRASDVDHVRLLDVPSPQDDAVEFVMLGNHSHVLQNGSEVYQSIDLGLSWRPLEAPAPVETIWVDSDGNLLAATTEGVKRWNYVDQTWSDAFPLPDGKPIEEIRDVFDDLFAVADGDLYKLNGNAWQRVELPAEDAEITSIAVKFPGGLWALDAANNQLWSSVNGDVWNATPITVTG